MKTERVRCVSIQERTEIMSAKTFILTPRSILTQYFQLQIIRLVFVYIKHQQLSSFELIQTNMQS